jgi:hypothetical protein
MLRAISDSSRPVPSCKLTLGPELANITRHANHRMTCVEELVAILTSWTGDYLLPPTQNNPTTIVWGRCQRQRNHRRPAYDGRRELYHVTRELLDGGSYYMNLACQIAAPNDNAAFISAVSRRVKS